MGRKILVVEDNVDSRFLVVKVLSRAGFETLEAESGEEAIRLSHAEAPDLVLMDLGLIGMDGLTATAELKKDPATKHIPVIALTAYAMDGDREKTIAAGCDGYITKPIDTRALPGQVARYLGGGD